MHGYHQTPCGVRIDGEEKDDYLYGEKGGGDLSQFFTTSFIAETKFLNS
jgi:hypothetical protein